jgi:hypothetical protein
MRLPYLVLRQSQLDLLFQEIKPWAETPEVTFWKVSLARLVAPLMHEISENFPATAGRNERAIYGGPKPVERMDFT